MSTQIRHESTTGIDTDRLLTVHRTNRAEPLRECVREALSNYFGHINGHPVSHLYDMVLAEVEQPLIETTLRYTGGNQTQAAAILGISRSTLRKKLADYGIV
jgi:Fis family transcriptional regulator